MLIIFLNYLFKSMKLEAFVKMERNVLGPVQAQVAQEDVAIRQAVVDYFLIPTLILIS